MSLIKNIAAAAVATLLSTAAFADGIMVQDPYVRTSRPNAPTAAAFMVLMNHTDADDRLIGVRSEIAQKVELHTHVDQGGGLMRMTQIEDGIALPAGETHALARGGDHVMLMGLNQSLAQDDEVTITLVFETAGEVVVTVPVDNERKAEHGAADGGHADHKSH
ncbi:copper chaperone PCu(A)C [Pseudosulfitobacter koreensis]|uniref:Copper chaperone PCu(A)C n=1 Tax=Pseudosulfitobacter koreensis TaxID=2968472 RepID=A0ABT1Z4B9_9RHOB|nr:copper chaperone PCu(A)C [Pseudosulfitobacter koreense]MCR8827953.1 copper chaperone PCu(A)C [Pseudosulfitobacter koreense]